MKKLIILTLLLLSFNIQAEKPNKITYNTNSGLVLVGTGVAFSLIAIACPDGSEWKNSKMGQGSYIITKPWYQNPARDIVLGIGVTFSIGGLIYQHNNKQ